MSSEAIHEVSNTNPYFNCKYMMSLMISLSLSARERDLATDN